MSGNLTVIKETSVQYDPRRTSFPSKQTISRTLDLVAGGLVLGLVVGVVGFMALSERNDPRLP